MKNNTAYGEMEHPRWGVIMSVRVTEEEAAKLEPGDELFAYYGYKGATARDLFPWYMELYDIFEPQINARLKEIRRKEREDTEEWQAMLKKRAEEKEEKKKAKRQKKKQKKDKKERNEIAYHHL